MKKQKIWLIPDILYVVSLIAMLIKNQELVYAFKVIGVGITVGVVFFLLITLCLFLSCKLYAKLGVEKILIKMISGFKIALLIVSALLCSSVILEQDVNPHFLFESVVLGFYQGCIYGSEKFMTKMI